MNDLEQELAHGVEVILLKGQLSEARAQVELLTRERKHLVDGWESLRLDCDLLRFNLDCLRAERGQEKD